MNRFKKEKGVTLIALGVTIVILIIIAAITLNEMGDNGVLKRSKNVISQHEEYKEGEKEKLHDLVNETSNDNDKPVNEKVLAISPSTKEWTNKDVIVTSEAFDTKKGEEIYLKKGASGTWQKATEVTIRASEYSGPVEVYAGVVMNNENANNPYYQVSITIDNIDTVKPTDTAPSLNTTGNRINVTCRQEDELSKIDESKTLYAIRERGTDEWSNWQSSRTFENLKENTYYEVKTKATDNAGNEQESQIATAMTRLEYNKPTDTEPTGVATTCTITVTVQQEDPESGIDESKTRYAIRKEGETEWSEWQTSNIFIDLDDDTVYEIKTKVTDNSENEQESKVAKVRTEELLPGTLNLRLDDAQGEAYTSGEPTNHNVYVELVEGNGTSTTYASYGESAQTISSTDDETIVNTEGTTNIRITATDGHNTATAEYTIIIDKTAPKAIIYGGATAVKNNLIRYYDAENNLGNGHDNSATEWNDLSAHQNASISNVTFDNGGFANFNGTNSWANMGQVTNLTNVTVDVELRINAIQSGEREIVCNYESGGFGLSIQDGVPEFVVYTNKYHYIKAKDTLIPNKSYHLTGTYDGSRAKLYIDGVLCVDEPLTGTIKDPTSNTIVAIGANPGGNTARGNYTNMKLFAARIYGSALTQAQIKQNMNADRVRTSSVSTADASVTLSIVTDSPVKDLTADDFTVTYGTKGAFTKISDTEYTLAITNITGSKTLKVVLNNTYTDLAGNNGNSFTVERYRDVSSPAGTITSDVASTPTNADTITYTITFHEEVIEFTTEDITVTNGVKGTFTKVNARTYTLVVTGGETGAQTISFPAGACFDQNGNLNTARSYTTQIDKTPPTEGAAVYTPGITTIDAVITGATDDSGIKEYDYYIDGTKVETSEDSDYQFTGLTPNTEYTIKYVVRDNVGNETTSEEVTVCTLAAVPTISATGGATAQGKQITLTIDANSNPANTTYEIYCVTDSNVVYTGTDLSYVKTGLGTNVTKKYKVRAKNKADVYTDYSAEATGNTLASPTVTKNVTSNGVNSGTNNISLSWNTVPGATGYGISVFDGKAYRNYNLGNVTSWDSNTANIYPTAAQISSWNGTSDPFRWNGDGQDWKASSNEMYLKANGNYKTYSYYEWIHVYSYDSASRVSGTANNGARSVVGATLDTDAPNQFTPTASQNSSNSVTITGSTTDQYMTAKNPGSGIRGYKFGIYKNGEWEWSEEQAGTSYTFAGLIQSTDYPVKMQAFDNMGNYIETTAEVTGSTTAVPDISGDITWSYSTLEWTKGTVTATASTTITGYTLQTSQTSPTTGFEDTASQTRTTNGNVYARLWDGTNYGATASTTINNIDKTAPTITSWEIANLSESGYDVYVYGVSDSQSGVDKVLFPTWTIANGQDDLQKPWRTNGEYLGENLGNGTWHFRVNVSDHNYESGVYATHIYTFDNVGNEKKVAGTENIQVPAVKVTYDYNLNTTIPSGEYLDTGFAINWDKNFKLETTINIAEQGKRYLVFGGYQGGTHIKELNIEITTANKLRVYYGVGGHDKTAGTIYANEDVNVTFIWDASTKTYQITARGTSTNITMSNTVDTTSQHDPSGLTDNTLRVGCADYRGNTTTFNPIAIRSLKITNDYTSHTALSDLPIAVREGYSFTGWSTSLNGGNAVTTDTLVPDNNVTYYANWLDNIAPTITTATPSGTWDIENFVDFDANDKGTGINAYAITTSNTAPTEWIPVISTVEEHTETKRELSAAWARVFHQNTHYGEVYYTDADEAKSFDSTETVDKYSVLGNLDSYKNNNNIFEFLLQYPLRSTTQYNRWKQNDNPVTLNIPNSTDGQQVPGYQSVHTDWTGSKWGGMALNLSNTSLLDGEPGHTYWNFAIGVYSRYRGSMPGPHTGSATYDSVANLWSRIDEKTSSVEANLKRRIGDLRENRTYYVWVKDANGNTSSRQVTTNRVDITKPTASITSTNNVAASQTATLSIGDNTGAVSYYWGTSNPTTNNVNWTSIASTTSTTVNKTVSNNGTYYLGVKDAAGNVTVVSKVFYKTTLTPGRGTVTPTTIITMSGNTVDLPNASAIGATFTGWYTAATDGTKQNTAYTPTGNTTLYGHWTLANYQLSYNLDDGTVATDNPEGYTIDSSEILLNNPTKVGYNFTGWTEKIKNLTWSSGFVDVNTGLPVNDPTYPDSHYTDFISLRSGEKYTITQLGSYNGSYIRWRVYNTSGTYLGNKSSSATYTATSDCYVRIVMYQATTEELRNGIIVNNDTAASTSERILHGSAGNREFTANWEAKTFTATYNANGGTVSPSSKEVTYNSTYGTLATPSKSGYTFKGWSYLPEGYTQLQYIEATGTQYINSGYKPGPNTGVEATYQFTATTPVQQRIYGIHGANGSTATFSYTYYINGSGNMAYAYKNEGGNWVATGIKADTSKHTFSFNTNKGYWKYDSRANAGISEVTATNTAPYNMFILAATTNGTSVANNDHRAHAKLYSFNIYENGNIVRQYVPCKNSNGEVGLYEVYQGIFYGNIGSGTFTEGPVEYVTDATTVSIPDNHTLYAKYADETAPTAPTVTAKLTNASGAAYTEGEWTNKDIYVQLDSTETGSGIKEFQWYENGAWTTRALTTEGNSASITYTVNRNETIRYRAIDNANNISDEATLSVKIDKTKPTITASNITYGQNLSITLKDSASKVVAWQVTGSSTTPTSGWTDISETDNTTVTKSGLTAGTKYIWAKDKAGNIQSKAITVNKAEMTLTSGNYTGPYDKNSHSITLNVTTPSSGTQAYYSTTTALTSSNYSSAGSTTKPTRTDVGTTTVYWYVKSNNANYNDKSGSNTITIDPSTTLMAYVNGDYSGVYDGNAHQITLEVTDPTGCTLYYSDSTALTSSNYNTAGSTTSPSRTIVGTTTVYWYIKSSSPNYADKAGSNTITISKYTMSAPTVNIDTDGKVTWASVTGATSYQISFDNSTWTTATSGSQYIDKTSTGSKTAYVRAVSSDTTNYNTPSAVGQRSVNVYSLTLNKDTGISSVSGAGNYVSGKVINIDATVATGYSWNTWTKTSGTAPASAGTKATTVTINANTVLQATSTANNYQLTRVNDNSNIISNGDFENYTIVDAPTRTANGVTHSWDQSLNGIPGNTSKAYNATGWGTGANMGVQTSEIGYHGHIKMIDGNAVFDFKTNEDFEGMTQADVPGGITVGSNAAVTTGRWLGISQGITPSKITAGKKYMMTADVYRVSGSNYVTGGLHYAVGTSTTKTFKSGQCALNPTTTGQWQTLSWTFTVDSTYNSAVTPSLYVYGNVGGAGECYVDNVRLEEVSTDNSSQKTYNTNYTSAELPTLTRTGYTFGGWYNNGSYTTSLSTSNKFTTSTASFEKVGTAGTPAYIYAKWTPNPLTFNNKTITKTFSTSAQTDSITAASNGTGSYTYTEKSEKNSGGTATNYISISGTTINIAAGTPAGTYTYVITAKDNNSHVTKDATYTITINKQSVNAPTNVNVTTAGIVTWAASSNATGYQISIDGSSWTNATSGVDYLSTIIGSTGSRTVYVRAINSDTANYSTPSGNATKGVTVRQITFSSNNTTMGVVDTANYKVISGATVSTSSNTLTVKGKNASNSDVNLKTVTAAPKTGYKFVSWSQTSGSITENTTITATFESKILDITLDINGGSTQGTETIYEKYNTGYYTDSACTTQMTTSSNAISQPTRVGYTFAGYYTAATGGTQYIDGTGKLTSSASTTNFADNGTLFAHWTPNTNTPYVVNHYTHNYGSDTYTLNSTENKTGTSDASLTLESLKKTITGYTYLEGFENTGDTTKPTSGAVDTTTVLPDGTRVINIYYRPNLLYVQYHMNGGSLASNHGAAYTTSGSLICTTSGDTRYLRGFYGSKVGGVNTTTYATATTDGLHNYNSSSNINITKAGYTAQVGAQWNTLANGTGTSYNQDTKSYTATGMATACGYDLSAGDVTVTLYVNWVAPNYGSYSGTTLKAYYATLADAMSKATSGYTVKPLKTLTDGSTASPTLASGRTLTLDLNGYTVTMSKAISNAGNLTITGTGELTTSGANTITNTGTFTKSGESTISNTSTYVLNNTGTATLSAGNIISNAKTIKNNTAGKINITGATVSTTDSTSVVIDNLGTSTGTSTPSIKMTAGTLSGNYRIIETNSSGDVYITGGTVTNHILSLGTGNIIIGEAGSTSTTSPEITGTIQNLSGGNVIVNGGKITSETSFAIHCNNEIIINGGSISTTGNSSTIATGEKLTITGGNISNSIGSSVIQSNVNTTIEMSGGSIIAEQSSYAIHIEGTTTITGGTVTSMNGIAVSSKNVTIGDNDGTVNSIPTIVGAGCGVAVQTGGQFYFYDGAITGAINWSISKNPDGVAPGYEVKKTISGTTETATLALPVTYTAGNYSGDYDGSAHTITGPNVTAPANGYTVYYSTSTALTSSNYSTSGSTTKPTRTNAGTTTVYWYVESGSANYNDKAGSNTITINKVTPTITLSPTSADVTYNSTGTFTATVTSSVNCAGTLKATSNGTSYVTITGGASNSVTATSTGVGKTITYKGVGYRNSATTITVAFTPSNTTNFNSATSKTFTVSKVNAATMTVSSSNYSGTYDGSAHTITGPNVTTPSSGYTIYYSATTALTSSNYSTSGSTTKPERTNAGTTTVYWYIKSGNTNYADKSGSNTITISKQTVNPPTNINISTAGDVTWTASDNATGYEISENHSNWSPVTSGDNFFTLPRATEWYGWATMYVRAINSDTTNYASPSNWNTTVVTVDRITFDSNNTTMGTVDTAYYDVIDGVTVNTSGNTLTLKGKNASNADVNLKTVTATAKTGYQFSSWSKTSGSITANTTITATFASKILSITLDKNGGDTQGTETIYEKYNTGYYTNSACTTQMTTSSNAITQPTRVGYTFAGYYTAATGGTQYIDGTGKLTSSASTTNFADNGTLYAHWTANTNTPYVVNHYTHNYGSDTYTLNSTENKTGTSDASLTLANLKKTITGYTYLNGFANAGDTTRPSSGAVTTTTISADGTRIINLYYRPNYLYVQYDMNGGSLASNHGAAYTTSGSLISNTSGNTRYLRGFYGSKVGGVNTTTYATATSSGLHDYNNSSGINVVNEGYVPQIGAQWNTLANGTGTSYNQATTSYNATAMATACGYDLGAGDVTVTLYLNWVAPNYGSYSGTTLKAYYATLADAMSKATSGYTVKPLKTLTDGSTASPTLASGRTLTLDLNGYTVTMGKSISNAGTLTITGTGELTSTGFNTIVNTGTFTKSGESTISNTSTATYYVLSNTGTATISAGNVTSSYRAISNGAAGKLNITGGTVSSTTSNITIENAGTSTGTSTPAIKMTGGTVQSAGNYAIQHSSAGHIYVTGGTITTTGATAIYGTTASTGAITIGESGSTSTTSPEITGRICADSTTAGDITINGGKITGTSLQAVFSKASIYINGGDISATSSYAVYPGGGTASKARITGGTITSKSNSYAVTTANASGGTIEIIGGTISKTTGTNPAVNNQKGTTTITGGTINSSKGSGVYATSGTVTIGDDDGTVNTTPSITGATYGVQVTTGSFYFYDGTITGKTNQSINKNPTGQAPGYEVKKTISGTTETATLALPVTCTSGNYSGNYDGSSHTITGPNVTAPASGSTVYYSTSTALTYSNYSTSGSTTKPTATNAGTTTVYWYVESGSANYNDKAGSNTITINKITPTITLSPTSAAVTYNSTGTFTATVKSSVNCAGTLTATSDGTDYVSITGGASNSVTATSTGVGTTITYKGVGYINSATTITVAFTPSNTTNFNSATSKTFTVSKVNAATMTVSSSNYSGTYDGSAHTITGPNVTTPSSGYTIYYSDTTALTSSNYSTSGSTTKPERTIVGTTTVYWYIKSGSTNYADKSGSNTITISKQTVNPPTSVNITTAGIVTWTASSNATGYQISTSASSGYTDIGNVTSYDYLSAIIASAGTRRVYVKAVNSDTTNYATPSTYGNAQVAVQDVSFNSNDTNMGTVDTSTYNVINGSTVSVSGNTLTIKGKNASNTDVDLKTITATAKTNYKLDGWSKSSGSLTAVTNVNALFSGNVYAITLNKNGGDTQGTSTIYEKYNTGYYTNSGCTTKMTTSANPITIPTKTGYEFKGYYTASTGGTQYINGTGKLTSSASTTNFTAAGTLWAQWEQFSYKNTRTGTYYKKLAQAYNAATSGDTIQVMKDVEERIQTNGYTSDVIVTIAKDIKLDLQSYTITTNEDIAIDYTGSLTILGTGAINRIEALTDGTVESAIRIDEGNLSIKTNATISINAGNACYGIQMQGGTLNIENGTIIGGNCGIKVMHPSSYVLSQNNTVNISGGTIDATTRGTSETYGIYDASAQGSTVINITGGTIGSLDDYRIGIYATISNNTVNITGGTVMGGKYGCRSMSNAVINVGSIEQAVNNNNPIIIGNEYGVYKSNSGASYGVWNFYNGIIKGKTLACSYYAVPSNIRDGYYVRTGTETIDNETYQIAYLNKDERYLKLAGTSESNFLTTSISRYSIKNISFATSISGHTIDNTTCWDVSQGQDGSVLAWIASGDATNGYTVVVGQDGGVKANPDSSYLFKNIGRSFMGSTVINVQNLDTSNVTKMMYTFANIGASQINLNNFNTSSVTDMRGMFSYSIGSGSRPLTSLDLRSFNTSNVTDMRDMFYTANGLTTTDNLTSINLNSFNTSKVTQMNGMFRSCSGLTSIDVSGFDTSSAINMSEMFSGMNNITSLDLNSFDTSKVTSMTSMFYRMNKLKTIYVSNDFVTSQVNESQNMFYNDTKLVGGAGTTFNSSKVDKTYAHIDGGTSNPGYFTERVIYNSTFPLNSNGKPSWLGNVTNGGSSYYFDVEGTSLTSAGTHGNKGKNASYCRGYIPINLTSMTTDQLVKLSINYKISSQQYSDIGYFAITTTTSDPSNNASTIFENTYGKAGSNGALYNGKALTTIQGGQQYYLHFWYYKDGSSNYGNDCLEINSIRIAY